jgi:hypothetical protein
MSFDGVRSVSRKAAAWRQARSQGSRSGDLVVGRSFAFDCLSKGASCCAIFCSVLTLSFFVVTPVFADEALERRIKSFLTLTILKLEIQATVCGGYTSVDTALINRKLQEYTMASKGLTHVEAIDKTIKELRAELGGLPAAESQLSCMDELRKSIDEYSAMRDVFLHRKLDKGIPPPLLDRETVGLQ